MQIIAACILFAIGGSLIPLVIKRGQVLYYQKKHYAGKHHCNHCEVSFISDKYEVEEYKYCPYCGRALTYHCEEERCRETERKAE